MYSNVISISGMPVSGKGTTVNALIKLLKEEGYTEENIHHIETGKKFRKYFRIAQELIKNGENLSNLPKSIVDDREASSLIRDENFRNKIIDTIKKIKKQNNDLSNFSIEQANNMKELKDIRVLIDDIIDGDIRKIGREIDKSNDEIWIVDSRLAFSNIPDSFAIRLVVDENVAAQRLYNDVNRGSEDNNYKNIEMAKNAIKNRTKGEVERYKDRYNVDLENEDNYNLIIDTSYAIPEDIARIILKCYKEKNKGNDIPKKWASPRIFLPIQDERSTLGKTAELDINEIIEKIENEGYDITKPIKTIRVGKKHVIIDGHHRNFGAAYAGISLIPYTETEDKNSNIGQYTFSKYLPEHEWLIGKDFSYEDVYPGIYQELKRIDDLEL